MVRKLYATIRLSFKRPVTTPPYLSLAFFILSFANAAFQMFLIIIKQQEHFASTAFVCYQVLTIFVALGLICAIGQIPVRDKLAGSYVALAFNDEVCLR